MGQKDRLKGYADEVDANPAADKILPPIVLSL